MAEIQLEKLLRHFSQCNQAEGKSPKTIEWYGEIIGVSVQSWKLFSRLLVN